MVNKEVKKEIIEKHKMHDKDTGSSKVQIALLTENINRLTGHFQQHKKDHHSRRGLLVMVGKRRRHLDYLKKVNNKEYQSVLQELGIRK